MDKPALENDLKGLEAEIDSAVDRLFVEDAKDAEDGLLLDSTVTGPPLEIEKPYETLTTSYYDKEKSPSLDQAHVEPVSFNRPALERVAIQPTAVEPHTTATEMTSEEELFPAAEPGAASDPLESIEAQLLSLEWEISGERIGKAMEGVADLRGRWSGQPQLASVLARMESVLKFMLKNETNIHPGWIKFLIDAKDTLKCLKQEEAFPAMKTYKQLAYDGIEARYSCLTEGWGNRTKPASAQPEITRSAGMDVEWKKIGEIGEKIDRFTAQMSGTLGKIEERLLQMESRGARVSLEPAGEGPAPPTFMVFNVEGKFFGVPWDRILRLFKVPQTFRDRFADHQKVRLRNMDVKLVDLRKRFSLAETDPDRELKILIVKDDGIYRGLMIGQVFQKVATRTDLARGTHEAFIGSFPWVYQERPVEISVLDVTKL